MARKGAASARAPATAQHSLWAKGTEAAVSVRRCADRGCTWLCLTAGTDLSGSLA